MYTIRSFTRDHSNCQILLLSSKLQEWLPTQNLLVYVMGNKYSNTKWSYDVEHKLWNIAFLLLYFLFRYKKLLKIKKIIILKENLTVKRKVKIYTQLDELNVHIHFRHIWVLLCRRYFVCLEINISLCGCGKWYYILTTNGVKIKQMFASMWIESKFSEFLSTFSIEISIKTRSLLFCFLIAKESPFGKK